MLLKNKIYLLLLTILLLFFSGVHFGKPMVDDRAAFFGDTGDGYFNVWILEHNYQNVINGDLKLFDGRIYQPNVDGNTLLWSDNLFVPSVFYSGFRFFTNSLTASYYTGLLLSVLSYLSYLLLFFLVFRIVNDFHKKLPEMSVLLVPLFAYVANFSISKLEYYNHFQLLAFCFVVSLFACLLGYFFYRKRLFFAGMLFSEVALLYSTPYFAVLGICFAFCWFIVQSTVDWRDIFVAIKENIASIFFAGGLFVFLAFFYMKVEKIEYSLWVFREYRATFSELYIPQFGLFKHLFRNVELFNTGESPVYLGMGLVIGGLLLLLLVSIPAILKFLKSNYKNYKFYIVVVLLICYYVFLLPIKNSNIVGLVGILLLIVTLTVIFAKLIDRKTRQSTDNMFALLALGAIFCYGIAFGPSKYFMENDVNPTVWGILYKFIPGVSSMRAIGRMCVPGQGLLLAIVFAYILILMTNNKLVVKRVVVLLVVLCLTIQIAESITVKAKTTYRYPSMVMPMEQEREFFEKHSGLYLLLPSTPWHKNSQGMIYFTGFQKINLMNGYSAKSTVLWDSIMNAEISNGALSQAVVDIASANSCDYIVISKRRIPKYSYQRHIKHLNLKVVFNNNRYVVLSL